MATAGFSVIAKLLVHPAQLVEYVRLASPSLQARILAQRVSLGAEVVIGRQRLLVGFNRFFIGILVKICHTKRRAGPSSQQTLAPASIVLAVIQASDATNRFPRVHLRLGITARAGMKRRTLQQ